MLKCLITRVDCSSFVPRGNGRTHTPLFRSISKLHGFRSANRRVQQKMIFRKKKFSRKIFRSNDRERCDFGARLSGDVGWHLAGMFLSSLFQRKRYGRDMCWDVTRVARSSSDFLNSISSQKLHNVHIITSHFWNKELFYTKIEITYMLWKLSCLFRHKHSTGLDIFRLSQLSHYKSYTTAWSPIIFEAKLYFVNFIRTLKLDFVEINVFINFI